MFSARLILLNTSPTIFPLAIAGPAAVAGVERGVDLDPQAGGRVIQGGILDPRDDPLRDRKLLAAHRIAVGADGLLHGRQFAGHRHGVPPLEQRGAIDLDDRQVDTRGDGDHAGLDLVGRLVGLDQDLAGVQDHVAAVRIRFPSMITPDPDDSCGVPLDQGRTKSGSRCVE